MTVNRRTATVRHPLGLGRLLPLGGPHDAAWLTEAAADAVLRRAAAEVAGVRLGAVRIAPADPADVTEAAVPAPPGAVPPGPLRLSADFAATAAVPLPTTASGLRRALAAATERLGLAVTEVDLRVTDLLEEETAEPEAVLAPRPPSIREGTDPEGARVTAAALAVPGVARVTGALSRQVHFDTALPRRHVRVEVALADGPRAVEVARGVRTAVGEALDDQPTVAVLVTSVG
ncbi:nucleopolyhedrovirus P10 family protein [Streptomyces shenzhenensis]|uniref:nucleopolyhedrovirus P10 family protein n=1 Tax=Streptomyces shenzhenensis TaxID=943815 RepID=UPI001F312C6D|nr:nucleopolyhedrovirus P10 family protein [Streptomyces shenzhenensis]